MISEISPFKDFVCIKVCHNRRVRCFGIVLVCPCLYTNRTSKELQTLLSLFFFSKFELPNRGCGLSTGAAYTRNFTVVDRYSFGLISLIVPVHDHLSKATTFLCSKGGHLQESCLYTQVRIFIINSPNITVLRLANLNR